MTLVTVCSVKGSPGVTTFCLELGAGLARRLADPLEPVVVAECDSAGGDLAPRLGLPGLPGIASLALRARRGVDDRLLDQNLQAVPGVRHLAILAGVAGPEQGAALRAVFPDLAAVLARRRAPAVADLGRVKIGDDPVRSLQAEASCNLLVSGNDASAALHARSSAECARRIGVELELVVVGDSPYAPRAIAEAAGVRLAGTLIASRTGQTVRRPFPGSRRQSEVRDDHRRAGAGRRKLAEIVDTVAPRLSIAPDPPTIVVEPARSHAWLAAEHRP